MSAGAQGEPSRSPWLALVAVCLGFFLVLLDSTIVAVAIPTLARDLEVDESTAVWANSAYLFASAAPLLVAGRLGDRFGARRIYLIGLVVFVVASLACGLAWSLPALIAARVVQGLGAALMAPQTLVIVRAVFPPHRMPVALGVWGAIAGVAALAGPVLGGVLIVAVGWPAIFLVNVPIGVVAIVLAVRWVPRLAGAARRIPVLVAVVSAVGILAVVVAVHETPSAHGWVQVALPIVGVIGAVVTVLVLRSQPADPTAALVPSVLWRHRGFVAPTLGASGASVVVGGAVVAVMVHLQSTLGLAVGTATLVAIPMGIVSAAASPIAGRAVARWGAARVAVIGGAAMVVSMAGMSIAAIVIAPAWTIAVALGLFGLANAFVWSPFAVAAMTSVELGLAGAASGAYNATRQVAVVIGSAIAAAMLAIATPGVALAVLGIAAIVALGAAIAMLRPAAETA